METFTAEEIAEIVHELGLPAQVEVNEDGFVSVVFIRIISTCLVECTSLFPHNGACVTRTCRVMHALHAGHFHLSFRLGTCSSVMVSPVESG